MPRFATGARPHAIVTNLGAPAIEMARAGATGREEPAGQMLWKGACTLVAGATIPFFGFGLKMFAFADSRTGKFHLRCGDAGSVRDHAQHAGGVSRRILLAITSRDFLCDRVGIQLDRETAIEAGGELLGRRNHVELAIGTPITLVALETLHDDGTRIAMHLCDSRREIV